MAKSFLYNFRRAVMSPLGIAVAVIPSVIAIFLNSFSASMWCIFAEAVLITLYLFLHDDIDACLMPFLCIMATGTTMLGIFTDFFSAIKPFLPFGAIVFIAIIFHFVFYRKPFSYGHHLFPLIACAIAILLGGVGTLALKSYLNLTSLYYLSGLSILPILLYLIYSNRYHGVSAYGDRCERFMMYMTALGIVTAMTAFVVMMRISAQISIYVSKGMLLISDFPFRNTLCTLIIMSIPPAFCLAGMKKFPLVIRSLFFVLGNVFYFSLIISTSRTAMLFGGVILLLSLFVYIKNGSVSAREKGILLLLLATVIAVFISKYGAKLLPELFERLENGLLTKDENRYTMLLRSFSDFCENPIFGVGMISDRNTDVYTADGCISWYHMYFPQIWGAMGILGCLCFGYLLFHRLYLSFTRWNEKTSGVILSYFALFLFSQTDTGEFNPIPFAMLSVLIFVLLEQAPRLREFPLEQKIKSWKR
ncbi:MAG: O-antigen ligase family protein [Clostridia bacterium]|nr:O-antigen ligase family protein [Clostridia bacterium]